MSEISIGELVAQLSLDSSEMKKGIGEVSEHMEGLKHVIEALGLVEAWHLAGEAIHEVTNAYAQNELALKKVAAISGSMETAKRFEELATSLSHVSTFSQDATMNAAAVLEKFDLTDRSVATLLPSLQNYASAMGTDLTTASQAYGIAVSSGEVSTRRLGIAMTEAEKAAFKQGTETERTAMLTEKLAKFNGLAAEEANTAMGAHKQLTNQTEELYASIGSVIDQPLAKWYHEQADGVQKVTEWIHQHADQIKSFSSEMTSFLDSAVSGIKSIASNVLNFFDLVFASLFSEIAGAQAFFSTFADEFKSGSILDIGKVLSDSIDAGVTESLSSLESLRKNSLFNPESGSIPGFDFAGSEGALGPKDFSGKSRGIVPHQKAASQSPLDFGGVSGIGTALDLELSGNPLQKTLDMFAGTMMGFIKATNDATVAARENLKVQDTDKLKIVATQGGEKVLSAMGDAGNVIRDGMKGFTEGGPMGAIAAVGIDLLMQTKGFQSIMGTVQKIMGTLVQVLEPIMGPVAMLVGALGNIIQPIGTLANLVVSMATVLFPFNEAIGLVSGVINFVAKGLSSFVNSVVGMWNGFLESVANLLSKIPAVGDDLAKAVRGAEVPLTKANDAAAGSATRLSNSLDRATNQNVPAIFKTAYATFAAGEKGINPNTMPGIIPGGAAGGSSSGPAGLKELLQQSQQVEAARQSRVRADTATGSVGLLGGAKAIAARTQQAIAIANLNVNTNASAKDILDVVKKEANKTAYNQSGSPMTGQTTRFAYGSG